MAGARGRETRMRETDAWARWREGARGREGGGGARAL